MAFEYNASGKIKVNGCSESGSKRNILSKYDSGERVWILSKAKMGKIESVVIKRSRAARPDSVSYSGVEWSTVYTDTFNRVWMERELVTGLEAEEIISEYSEKILQETRRFYEGECFPIKPEGCPQSS